MFSVQNMGRSWCSYSAITFKGQVRNSNIKPMYQALSLQTANCYLLAVICELLRGCLDLFGMKIVQSSSGSMRQKREA